MRRFTFASALGQFSVSSFDTTVYGAGKRQPKPQPKGPCDDVCKPGGSDAACAACLARGDSPRSRWQAHVTRGVPSMMNVGLRGCDGIGYYGGFIPRMSSSISVGYGGCATTCSPLTSGGCGCQDSAGNLMKCTCPVGFSFAPVQRQYYRRY